MNDLKSSLCSLSSSTIKVSYCPYKGRRNSQDFAHHLLCFLWFLPIICRSPAARTKLWLCRALAYCRRSLASASLWLGTGILFVMNFTSVRDKLHNETVNVIYPPSDLPMSGQCPADHRPMIGRWSADDRPMIGRAPYDVYYYRPGIGRWSADDRSAAGRRPVGGLYCTRSKNRPMPEQSPAGARPESGRCATDELPMPPMSYRCGRHR